MWKGRFEGDTSKAVQKFTQSLDLDWRLYRHDIRGSIAHARMLGSAGIITAEEADLIVCGLEAVMTEIELGRLQPSDELEDVHMNIESRVIELFGPIGAKLHTGRSRNDQIATTMRLYMRDRLLDQRGAVLHLLEALLNRAEAHLDVVVPGYTHLQQAQPISMGHYWMAWFEAFSRDMRRLASAYDALDECPLGSGALAGSTLPLNREATARELRFSSVSQNSMESVASRDYMADYHHFASMFAVHASRLAEDLIIYSTQEFAWIKLPDAFCTGSSMMPQKKNPDVLELIRGHTGQVIGHMVDLLVTMKGLPMTYDRDLQEDKRGLFASLDALDGVLEVLPQLLVATEVDAEAARAALDKGRGFALATDVAEHLVMQGIPFRDAHFKVGKLVKHCIDENKAFTDLSFEELKTLVPEADKRTMDIISGPDVLRRSVEKRNTFGGTGFTQVAARIRQAKDHVFGVGEALSSERDRVRPRW
ncbi:MAG: argininosuccinate lyase [Synergistaceae bacterium]|jgi:argininosuccinate lyase|nr:argininosuccinate lyase [Synergistaceae bacterium]